MKNLVSEVGQCQCRGPEATWTLPQDNNPPVSLSQKAVYHRANGGLGTHKRAQGLDDLSASG